METFAKYRTDFDVELVDHAGSDELICRAARVSTLGAASLETTESAGLINFLMRKRHGSPFEHSMMTFRITAPIFVWREFMRHRIGFSYNEESGRYKELDGVFYVPGYDRDLVQTGKTGEYVFERGSEDQYHIVYAQLCNAYREAWGAYQTMLRTGIAKEVARMCLPVATYSTAYVTCNPRSLMKFLSLRTKKEYSMFPSTPMWEINKVADMMEAIFAEKFPLTYDAFDTNHRVAP